MVSRGPGEIDAHLREQEGGTGHEAFLRTVAGNDGVTRNLVLFTIQRT
jgi:hypothetical protein